MAKHGHIKPPPGGFANQKSFMSWLNSFWVLTAPCTFCGHGQEFLGQSQGARPGKNHLCRECTQLSIKADIYGIKLKRLDWVKL